MARNLLFAAVASIAGLATFAANAAPIWRCPDPRFGVLYTNVRCPGGTLLFDAPERAPADPPPASVAWPRVDPPRPPAPVESAPLPRVEQRSGQDVEAREAARLASRSAAADEAAARWRKREDERLAHAEVRAEVGKYGWSPSATMRPWPPTRPWDAARAENHSRNALPRAHAAASPTP